MKAHFGNHVIEYSNAEELRIKANRLPNVSIGNDFNVGNHFKVGYNFKAGNHFNVGNNFKAGNHFNGGNNFKAGDDFNVGYNFKAGSDFKAGNHFNAGNDFNAGNHFNGGNNFKAGIGFKAGNGFKPVAITEKNGWYKYVARSYFEENSGLWYIQLGCFLRTVREWEEDFWNNPSEFPNDGSEASEARFRVYRSLLKNCE